MALGWRSHDSGRGLKTRTVAISAPQTKPGDQRPVSVAIILVEIRKQPTTPSNELQQPATGMMVVRVFAQVLDQPIDPLGEERDLNFR